MEKLNHQSESSSLTNLSIEKINDGDVLVINFASGQEIEDIIKKISSFFCEPTFSFPTIIKTILNDKENWRFESTFNLKLNKNNQLVLDNRNGRGIKENRDKLEKLSQILTNKCPGEESI